MWPILNIEFQEEMNPHCNEGKMNLYKDLRCGGSLSAGI
jgi:hypothetical protein